MKKSAIVMFALLFAVQSFGAVISYMNFNNDFDVESETSPTWGGTIGVGNGYFTNDVPGSQGHFVRPATFGTALYLSGNAGGNSTGLYRTAGSDLLSSGSVTSFTMEAWLKDDGAASTPEILSLNFGRGSDGYNGGAYIKYRSDANVIIAGFRSGATEYNINSTIDTKFTPEDWNHFSLIYDAATGAEVLYVNGTAFASNNIGTGITLGQTGMNPLAGNWVNGSWVWNGSLDDYRMSDEVINPEDDNRSGWYGPLDAIPEPTTAGIAVLGALLVAARLRRKHG